MMQPTAGFSGLTMPVFTAFGWAGEENAIKYALSQLEMFVSELHANLSREARDILPSYGLSEENRNVYLAASSDVESDIHIVFSARPMSLEIQLAITDKDALSKGLKLAEQDPALCHRLITELGPEWSLRVQQMQIDEDSGEAAHYNDLFKDDVTNLSDEVAVAVMSKAGYLNGDSHWVTPVYLSRRIDSERASAMGSGIVSVMSEMVSRLLPLISFFTGRTAKKAARRKPKPKPVVEVEELEEEPVEEPVEIDPEDGFSFRARLKPLHLRRGFINLTPEHWPFFAINSRTTTRDVTVYHEGVYDKNCSVWRLVGTDQARLVLSAASRQWLEDNFAPNDNIQLIARKLNDEEIQVTLKEVG